MNPVAQKQLKLVVWSANALGALAMFAIVISAYEANSLLGRERASVEAARLSDLHLLARAELVRADNEIATRQLESLTDQLADLRSRIPPSPKEAEFLAQVSALADRCGVRMKNFRPGQPTNGEWVSTCDVQLSVLGPYASICKLLDGLREAPRFLSVSRLTLAGPQAAGDPCVAEIKISLCFAAATSQK
jgi:Tfp pilus assembly protein PilO